MAAVAVYVLAQGLTRVLDLAPFPLTVWTASSVAALLKYFAIQATQTGAVLYQAGGFAYEIGGECLGLGPVAALAGLLFADQTLPRLRALHAFVVGAGVLLLVNFIRLVTLFGIGARLPEYFALAHDVLWPLILTTLFLVLWRYAHRTQTKTNNNRPSLCVPGKNSLHKNK